MSEREDVEVLAAELSGAAPEYVHLAIPNHMKQAERLLASPWLRAHDDRIRAEALAPGTPTHDATEEDACGKPRRYFPQQVCSLPRGHAGDHEDDTHLWENGSPAPAPDDAEGKG